MDFRAETVRVVRSWHPTSGFTDFKSEKSWRNVHLIPRLACILQESYDAMGRPDPNELTFPSKSCYPNNRQSLVQREFEPALPSAGLIRIRFNGLGHTYASLAIAAGTDPKALQSTMGHSSITVTMDTYGHLFPGHSERIVKGLDEMFPVSNKGSKLPNSPQWREKGEE